MDTQLGLRSAARRLASIVEAVPDDALGRPTPCERFTVGDVNGGLLDHVGRPSDWSDMNVPWCIGRATRRPDRDHRRPVLPLG